MTSIESQLEYDLTWRLDELSAIKREVQRCPTTSSAHKPLLRAMWTMLYAHYEGFFQVAFNIYVDELERRALKRKHCKDEIIVTSIDVELGTIKRDMSSSSLYSMFRNGIHVLLEGKVKFERDKRTNEFAMKGNSNLYPDKLAENCAGLCIEHRIISVHKSKLSTLVNHRNFIAHGRNITIDSLEYYETYEQATLDVMASMAVRIAEAVDRQNYLANEPEYSI